MAQYSRTSNAQNPRRCVYHSLDGFHTHFVPYKIRAKPMPEMNTKHPMSIYRCVVQDYTFELARFEASRTGAHDKRFPMYSGSLSFPSFTGETDATLTSGTEVPKNHLQN